MSNRLESMLARKATQNGEKERRMAMIRSRLKTEHSGVSTRTYIIDPVLRYCHFAINIRKLHAYEHSQAGEDILGDVGQHASLRAPSSSRASFSTRTKVNPWKQEARVQVAILYI